MAGQRDQRTKGIVMFDRLMQAVGLGPATAEDDGDDYRQYLRPGEDVCDEHSGACGPGCPGYEAPQKR